MARRKKKEVSLRSMTFYCGYIEREVIVPSDELEYVIHTDEYENHGFGLVNFRCKCGDNHHITLEEW